MMKVAKIFSVVVLLCVLFSFGATSLAITQEELISRQTEALHANQLEEAIPGGAQNLLGDTSLNNQGDFTQGIQGLLQAGIGQLGGVFREAARSAAIVIVIAMLTGIFHSLYPKEGDSGPNYVSILGVLAVSAAAIGTGNAFLGLGLRTMRELETFSAALFPTIAIASTAAGGITSATVKYAGTVLFLDILLTTSSRVIMPLIYAYIAASIGNAALGGDSLKAAANLLKWVTGILITTVMISFMAYLTITGVVSGSADQVTTRVTRTAISTALPVVGSIVSDAAETVLAGAAFVRNGIGVMGLLVILAICLVPLLQLGAHYLMFKAAAGLSQGMADKRIGDLISSFGTAFGMVMGLTGAGAMMLFFSIISMMRIVVT